MSTNHVEFINDQLPPTARDGQYAGPIQAVARAYEERDQELANSLYEHANRVFGARRERVNQVLQAAGLPPSREPQPQPQVHTTEDDGDLRASVDELKRQVGQLVELANRHLGASLR